MHADAEPHGQPGGGELFEHLEIDLVRLVPATVSGVVGEAEQTGLGQQTKKFAREASGLLLPGRVGGDLTLDDLAYEGEEILRLLGGQLTVHRLLGAIGHGGALLPVWALRRHTQGVAGAVG